MNSPTENWPAGNCSSTDSEVPDDILEFILEYSDPEIGDALTPTTSSPSGTDVSNGILEFVTDYNDPTNMQNTNLYNELQHVINEHQKFLQIDLSAPVLNVTSYSAIGMDGPTNEVRDVIIVPKTASPPSSMNIRKRTPGRYREPYSQSQLSALQESFRRCKIISPDERFALSLRTNLTERQIKYWFQNQRRKVNGGKSDKSVYRDGLTQEAN